MLNCSVLYFFCYTSVHRLSFVHIDLVLLGNASRKLGVLLVVVMPHLI